MLKAIFQFKVSAHGLPLLHRIITFLFTTLLMTISLQLATRADTDQFLLHTEAVKDLGSLAVKLQDPNAVISQYIVGQLSAETQQLLGEYDGVSRPSQELQEAFFADLNQLLQAVSLYDTERFANINLSEQTQELIEQNPQSGGALIRLNWLLLADVYPYEFALPSEKRSSEDVKSIQTCRENLRRIKLASENYRAETHALPEWLSDMFPQYLEEKTLICPADTTIGIRGILPEGASDPNLPCSYLYEFRPSERARQNLLLKKEGGMIPLVRCQHHLLNLSVSGKLYRNGPERNIYTGKQQQVISLQLDASGDLYAQLKAELGEEFLTTKAGKELLHKLAPFQQSTPNAPVNTNISHDLVGKSMPEVVLTTVEGKPVKLDILRGRFVLLNVFSTDCAPCGTDLQILENLLENADTSQLQAIGISAGGSAEDIEAFREKYQVAMPLWIDKKSEIVAILTAPPQAGLITLLLTPELFVKAVFLEFNAQSIKQKVEQFIAPKD